MNSKQPKYVKRSKMPKLSRKQLYGIIIVSIIVVSSLAVYAFFSNQYDNGFRAAIVDQLSSREEFRNTTFVKTANETLAAAGYTVTYHKWSEINVDFYRVLPTRGYKIVLLRVHSALFNGVSAPLDLFTNEPYSNAYAYEQSRGWLDITMYYRGGEEYFGILDGFVTYAMQGRFKDAVVILMGCNGLDIFETVGGKEFRSLKMLSALIGKGAKVCIGWNGNVTGAYTDLATSRLLHYLLEENLSIRDAVNATMNEVGPDPYTNAKLEYYPSKDFYIMDDVGNYTIPKPAEPVAEQTTSEHLLSFAAMEICVLPLLFRPVRTRSSFVGFKRKRSFLVFHNASKQQDTGYLASRFL
jgi:hypothetical protein